MQPKDYSFTNTTELLEKCEEYKLPISEIVIKHTANTQGKSEQEVRLGMKKRIEVIRESIKKGLEIEKRSKSGLSGGDAKKLEQFKKDQKNTEKIFLGETLYKAINYSFAIMEHNARFGRIVAFPTAGSAGTVPACLLAATEVAKLDDEQLVDAMFTAGAIGMITGENAMLAGASGGCQAEVGTASAMAAAGLISLFNGTDKQAFTAASIALKGLLGLVCDPLGGLVECPCVKRNATAVSNAYMAAQTTLAGVTSNIEFDQVLVAMNNIAKLMASELKETAKGGLAITDKGREVMRQISE